MQQWFAPSPCQLFSDQFGQRCINAERMPVIVASASALGRPLVRLAVIAPTNSRPALSAAEEHVRRVESPGAHPGLGNSQE